jgi:hypothetical protein
MNKYGFRALSSFMSYKSKWKTLLPLLGNKMTQIININASKENMETGEPLHQSQLTLILGIG